MNLKLALCLVVIGCMLLPAEAGWRRAFKRIGRGIKRAVRSVGRFVRKVHGAVCNSPAKYHPHIGLGCAVTGDVDFDNIEGLSPQQKQMYEEMMQKLADEMFDELSQMEE